LELNEQEAAFVKAFIVKDRQERHKERRSRLGFVLILLPSPACGGFIGVGRGRGWGPV